MDISAKKIDFDKFYSAIKKLKIDKEDAKKIEKTLSSVKEDVTTVYEGYDNMDNSILLENILKKSEQIRRKLRQLKELLQNEDSLNVFKSICVRIKKHLDEINSQIEYIFLSGKDDIKRLKWQTKALYYEQYHISREKDLHEKLIRTLDETRKLVGENNLFNKCFLSYAWPTEENKKDEFWVQPFLKLLHHHLQVAGLKPVLDIVNNKAGKCIIKFAQKIKSSEFVLLICTKSLLDKHLSPDRKVIKIELNYIEEKRSLDKKSKRGTRVLPLLLSGTHKSSYPKEYELYSTVRDWRGTSYVKNLVALIQQIYFPNKKGDNYHKYVSLWDSFFKEMSILQNAFGEKETIDYEKRYRGKKLAESTEEEMLYKSLIKVRDSIYGQDISMTEKNIDRTLIANKNTYFLEKQEINCIIDGSAGFSYDGCFVVKTNKLFHAMKEFSKIFFSKSFSEQGQNKIYVKCDDLFSYFLKNTQEATKLINKNVISLKNVLEVLIQLGWFHLNNKNPAHTKARKYYQIAIEITKKIGLTKVTEQSLIADIYFGLASSELVGGKYAKAEKILAEFQKDYLGIFEKSYGRSKALYEILRGDIRYAKYIQTHKCKNKLKYLEEAYNNYDWAISYMKNIDDSKYNRDIMSSCVSKRAQIVAGLKKCSKSNLNVKKFNYNFFNKKNDRMEMNVSDAKQCNDTEQVFSQYELSRLTDKYNKKCFFFFGIRLGRQSDESGQALCKLKKSKTDHERWSILAEYMKDTVGEKKTLREAIVELFPKRFPSCSSQKMLSI